MKKIFKSLLSGVLSVVLLTSSVPFASATENQALYDDFINNKEYINYIPDYMRDELNDVASEYSLFDVTGDGISELILKIYSAPNNYFSECCFVFEYNKNQQKFDLLTWMTQSELIYSPTYNAFIYVEESENEIFHQFHMQSPIDPKEDYDYGDELLGVPSITSNIGLLCVKGEDISEYYIIYYLSDFSGDYFPISQESYNRRINDLIEIPFYDLSEYKFYEEEYKYDEVDVGESLTIPTVNDVTTETEAINKVQNTINQATNEQKQSATGIDKLTLLVEEAAAKANTVKLTDNNVNVTSENIKTNSALQATTNVLTSANIQMQRKARNIVNYDLGDTETINVKTEDVSNKVDAVRVSTSYASATVSANTASDFTMTNKGEKTVEINFNKDTDTTVTISFPNMNENDKYYAVVDENGNPVGGKYNPATGTLEAKLSESGIYKVVNNEKDFSDIKDKSAEMQEAIKVLASKGIINGTTATTFAPDSTISRAEVTALLMRTISLLDPNANGNFADVNTSNWYCGAAGSAKEHNIINGYEDNTFRGNAVIAKDQIVAVSARTLKQQMNYKTPSDVADELSVYVDASSIANWAKEDVALATMANLVLKRTDSTFSGADGMTRGDAAIIMQRLFNKLW